MCYSSYFFANFTELLVIESQMVFFKRKQILRALGARKGEQS